MTRPTTTEAPASRTAAGALGPSPYGLSRHEIRNELRRLAAAGFQLWELHRLFGDPRHWGRPWT